MVNAMKAPAPMRRRQFLRAATGAVGGVAVADGFLEQDFAAEAPPPRRSRAELDKLLADLDAQGRPFMALPKADQQFLSLMVKATRARNVLELGAAYGFTSIWLALALEETDGKLTTIEIKPDRVEPAKQRIAEAGLSARVTCLLGDAHQIVPTLAGPFDFVFLNADKSGLMDYFQKLHPGKLAAGGLLLAYGAILLREKMKDYLNALSHHPDFDTVIVSATLDDGFAVSYRKRMQPRDR